MGTFEELTTSDERFANEVREMLDRGDELDPVTRNRLAAVRARALEAANRRGGGPLSAAAGSIVAVVVLAVLVLMPKREAGQVQPSDADVAIGELDGQFRQDLDLYRWIEGIGAVAPSPEPVPSTDAAMTQWRSLTPEQRERLRTRDAQLRELSPEDRGRIRGRFDELVSLPGGIDRACPGDVGKRLGCLGLPPGP